MYTLALLNINTKRNNKAARMDYIHFTQLVMTGAKVPKQS